MKILALINADIQRDYSPTNIYLFKAIIETLEKGAKYIQS